jgi:hypothetical protein
MKGNLVSSTAMVLAESNVEDYDSDDDKTEIQNCNDNFEMSQSLPVQSPNTLLKNMTSISSCRRQKKNEHLMTMEASFCHWSGQH